MITLWRRRRDEGWTQKQLADAIGRDRGWVSRNLRAPGNWTLHTAGELVQALNGDVDISVAALEDAPETPRNFDAYEGYLPARLVKGQSAFMATIALSNPVYASIDIAQGERYEIPAL